MSRSRGKPKPKLRDLSKSPLTHEEITALLDAVGKAHDPITTAVLGAVMVEHELDRALKQKIKRKDSWTLLTDDRGPLSDFSRKIALGYALNIYDEKFKHDLEVVRRVRNHFAHSPRQVHFNNQLVSKEISSARNFPRKLLKPPKIKGALAKLLSYPDYRVVYVILCYRLTIRLMKMGKPRPTRKPFPYSNALFQSLSPQQATSVAGSIPGSSLPSQNAGPNPPIPIGGLLGLLDPNFGTNRKKDT